MKLARYFEETTGEVMMSDHGMALRSQLTTDRTDWTGEHIVERLGVFLTFRFPEACGSASPAVTVMATRAAVECALSITPLGTLPTYKLIDQPPGGPPLFPLVALKCLALTPDLIGAIAGHGTGCGSDGVIPGRYTGRPEFRRATERSGHAALERHVATRERYALR